MFWEEPSGLSGKEKDVAEVLVGLSVRWTPRSKGDVAFKRLKSLLKLGYKKC